MSVFGPWPRPNWPLPKKKKLETFFALMDTKKIGPIGCKAAELLNHFFVVTHVHLKYICITVHILSGEWAL